MKITNYELRIANYLVILLLFAVYLSLPVNAQMSRKPSAMREPKVADGEKAGFDQTRFECDKFA